MTTFAPISTSIGDSHIGPDQEIWGEVRWFRRRQGNIVLSPVARRGRSSGVESVCCLLHNLIAGGSARQWRHLPRPPRRARRPGDDRRSPGPAVARARGGGDRDRRRLRWDERPARTRRRCAEAPRRARRRRSSTGTRGDGRIRAARASAGGSPSRSTSRPARWRAGSAPEVVDTARAGCSGDAAEDPRTRRSSSAASGTGAGSPRISTCHRPGIQVLPASIPLPAAAGRPASRAATEILALTPGSRRRRRRWSGSATELTRARARRNARAASTIAGDGPWRGRPSRSASRLPAGPGGSRRRPRDPLARLAAADLVVAQGLTTLEAAALERRVVVARTVWRTARRRGRAHAPSATTSRPRDPFGRPASSRPYPDASGRSARPVDAGELAALRALVARPTASRPPRGRWPSRAGDG